MEKKGDLDPENMITQSFLTEKEVSSIILLMKYLKLFFKNVLLSLSDRVFFFHKTM